MIQGDSEQRAYLEKSNMLEKIETISFSTEQENRQSFFLTANDIFLHSKKDDLKKQDFIIQNHEIILPTIRRHIFSHDFLTVKKSAIIDYTIDDCNKLFILKKENDGISHIESVLYDNNFIDKSSMKFKNAIKIQATNKFVFVLETDKRSKKSKLMVFSKDYLELQDETNDLDDNIIDMDIDKHENILLLSSKKITIVNYLKRNTTKWNLQTISLSKSFNDAFSVAGGKNDKNIYVLFSKNKKLLLLEYDEKNSNYIKKEFQLNENYVSFDVYDKQHIFSCTKNHSFSPPRKLSILEDDLIQTTNLEINSPTEKITVNKNGDLILLYNLDDNVLQKISKFDFKKMFESQTTIYLEPLDSTTYETVWHKISLEARVQDPNNSSIHISYAASDEIEPKNLEFKDLPANPISALFDTKGRYLWLTLRLVSQNGISSPALRSISINFPRTSYLKYLPSIYQQDQNSKKFLEQFFSIFENFFEKIDSDIYDFHRQIDPKTTTVDFLPWLSSMLGMIYDERWEQARFRRLLANSPELYKKRGTKEGLKKFLEIFLGIENSHPPNPSTNSPHLPLMIFENFQLRCIKNEKKQEYDEYFKLFGENPNTFSVLIDAALLNEKTMNIVKQIVENEKPAHTVAKVCSLIPWFYLGTHTYLGMNTFLGHQNFILGKSVLSRDTSVN